MANTIRLKRGSGSDPSASDLVVGELAIRTDSGKIFTKKDNGSVAEISGGGGIDDGDKGDITISNGGDTFTIDNGVVSTDKIADDAITAAKIAANAVGSSEIATDAVGSAEIAANAVTSAHIAANTITAGDIATDAVGSAEIAANAVQSAHIADGAIVNADINSSAAIAGTKISPNFGTQVIQTKASAVDTDMFKIIRQDHSTNPLFRIFQDSTYGGGTGGCHINSNNRPLIITAKSSSNVTSTSGLVLMSTGNLGIGENDPDEKLHIKNGNILLESTDTGSAAAPEIDLFRNSASPADADYLGQLKFRGEDSAGGANTYAKITGKIDDATNTTEDGLIEFAIRKDGSNSINARLTGTDLKLINGTGLEVAGNISCDGTVDGVDIATRDTLFGGLTSSSGVLTNGVTATTQSAGNNTTRVATTAFVTTAISNLINGAPGSLDTLNELAAAMNDDAAFSTTVTNSLATKMPLAGGQFTGNITFSGSQTVDGRDLSVDGSKLDGIESGATADQTGTEIRALLAATSNTNILNDTLLSKLNGIESGATADQTASEILTLLKTVDGAGSGLDADTLDGISSASFVRSDADDTLNGQYTISDGANEKLILAGSSNPYIRFQEGTTNKAYIQWSSAGYLQLVNSETGELLRIKDGNNGLTYRVGSTENIVFHAGNLSEGDGGLTTNNFTDADHSKLDGIESGATADQTASEILTLLKTVDGSGSGLDADLLDGYSQSASNSTNTIVRRNGSGYVFANYFNTTANDVTTNIVTSIMVESNNDNYIRHGKAGAIRSFLNVEDGATADQSASEILTLLKTVDGAGSGLDADTLDGISSASFLRSDAADTMTGDLTLDANALLRVGDGAGNERILIKKADNNVSDHIIFFNGTTRIGEIGCEDNTWLRINQETSKNIYTPRYIRADNGFFVDGTSKGINGSGNFIGGTIAGASDYSTLLRSNAADTATGDITFSGGAGAVTIAANSDVSFTNGSTWSGNHTKITHHGNYMYLVGGSNGFIFRESGTNRWVIDGSGHLDPATDSTYDIGENTKRVRHGYFDNLYGSGANITSINASNISSGTIAAARVATLNQNTTGTSGGFTAGNASNLNSGTIPDARFPSTLPAIDGSNLTGISAGATGGGSDEVFYENDQNVTTNYTITNGKNAMAAGPITINSGVTVTVGSGETLTIV